MIFKKLILTAALLFANSANAQFPFSLPQMPTKEAIEATAIVFNEKLEHFADEEYYKDWEAPVSKNGKKTTVRFSDLSRLQKQVFYLYQAEVLVIDVSGKQEQYKDILFSLTDESEVKTITAALDVLQDCRQRLFDKQIQLIEEIMQENKQDKELIKEFKLYKEKIKRFYSPGGVKT